MLVNPKFPRFLRIFTFIYVIGLLYATWWPLNTFAPWFVNLNDPGKINDIQTLNNIWYYSYIVYDCLFTILLLYEIYSKLMLSSLSSSHRSRGFHLIALKAILHNIFSIGGVYAFINYAYYGTTILDLAACFSLHLINWKFEKYISYLSEGLGFAALSLTRRSSLRGSSSALIRKYRVSSVIVQQRDSIKMDGRGSIAG